MKTQLFAKQYPLKLDSISEVRRLLSTLCHQLALEQAEIDRVTLVLAEYLSNLYFHNQGSANWFRIQLAGMKGNWYFAVSDSGDSFNPYKVDVNDIFNGQLFTGGMGLALIQKNNRAGCYTSNDGINEFICPLTEQTKKLTVVVVDDDRILLCAYRSFLQHEFVVHIFSEAVLALKFIEHEDCDLIIADIHMPEMSGFEFRLKVESFDKGVLTPFVFLTGDDNVLIQEQAAEVSIDGYLIKPITKTALLTVCTRVIRRTNQLALHYQQRVVELLSRPFKPSLPSTADDWHFSLAHTPASEGGGDFVFFHDYGDSKLLILGDIMGHGPVAKFHSFAIMGYLEGLITSTPKSPSELLSGLSKRLFLNQLLESSMLTCIVVKLTGNQCEIATAGHPQPYLLHKTGYDVIDCKGTVLGLLPNEEYSAVTIQLEPDEKLFFYSDGIFENIDRNCDGIDSILTGIKGTTAQNILDQLWLRFESLSPEPLKDDATAIVIELNNN
ncbi:SpoIIE family protein phosphatase [Moritella sp.]|uniref:SpoIIE family protein phosphatase n=1 Tax=Moritella sp. TaxID=78556 RepID=UPI001DD938C0|nr:SpoIIE family protein phosphatase [Moritella sp.]MCJ8350527.1 SpoIIE family protein phosphatase [Moritella sp.]NQZ41794.1 SpoIIE family protein phosphatase [Moritella sp.]